MTTPYDLARRAYGAPEDSGTPVRKLEEPSIEQAKLAYSLSSRAKETAKTPSRPALSNVLKLIEKGELPQSLRPIAASPPTREEARFLARDIQTLTDELVTLDKAITALPSLEAEVKALNDQRDSWIGGAIRAGVTDKSLTVNGIQYPHQLERTERMLLNITSEKDAIVRGSRGFADNNPKAMQNAAERLSLVRTELQAPMRYSEAKSGIPVHKKSVQAWLDDLRNRPALEDRLLAKKVLDEAGIDAKAMLTEVEREGMSPIDRAMAEAKDGQNQGNGQRTKA